eukprot:2995364-Heterocapsa_arctica.AAC.1
MVPRHLLRDRSALLKPENLPAVSLDVDNDVRRDELEQGRAASRRRGVDAHVLDLRLVFVALQSTAMTSKPCSRRARDRPAETQQSSLVTAL